MENSENMSNSGRTSPRMNVLNQLALKLYRGGIVKFGEFRLRSGAISPIYFDLRRLITNPDLILNVVEQYISLSKFDSKPRRVCGVAYTGIPIATVYSQESKIPMIMKRKEAKNYGTKQLIEGDFEKGDRIILVDDVITSGGSLIETAMELEKVGLVVEQIIVLIDRRPLNTGRPSRICGKYPIRVVFTMEDLLSRLNDQGINIPVGLLPKYQFGQRIDMAGSPVGQKLMKIIEKKQSNLVLSADVTTTQELLSLVDLVGPEICMVKTHIDLLTDFEYNKVIPQLQALAEKHSFLILEDRKFADIGNTVKLQYTKGVHRIIEWADLVTVHGLMGEGIVKAFGDAINQSEKERGILLLAQLSNAGNLVTQEYTESCCLLAERYPDLVVGLICQKKLMSDAYLHLTPGVNLNKLGDKNDQQYNTPDRVIGLKESDLMIVGRGIYQKVNPLDAARQYKMAGWLAYQTRIRSVL